MAYTITDGHLIARTYLTVVEELCSFDCMSDDCICPRVTQYTSRDDTDIHLARGRRRRGTLGRESSANQRAVRLWRVFGQHESSSRNRPAYRAVLAGVWRALNVEHRAAEAMLRLMRAPQSNRRDARAADLAVRSAEAVVEAWARVRARARDARRGEHAERESGERDEEDGLHGFVRSVGGC
jgi:hypothetical protein